MRDPKQHLSTFVILLLAVIWGSTWLGIKVSIDHYPPFFAAGTRFITAFLFLYVIMLLMKNSFPADNRSRKVMVFTGVLQSVTYGLVFWGEQFIDSGISAVLFSTMPFFVTLFSLMMIRSTALHLTHVAGIALSVTGTFYIFDPDFASSPGFIWGFAAILLSAIVSSYMAVYVKRHAENIPALPNTAVQMLIAGVVLSVVSLIAEPWQDLKWSSSGAAAIVYLGIIGSAVAFALYMWVIKKVSPLTASVIPLLTPIVALVIGWLILHEPMTYGVLTGTALILTGIAFINIAKGPVLYASPAVRNREPDICNSP